MIDWLLDDNIDNSEDISEIDYRIYKLSEKYNEGLYTGKEGKYYKQLEKLELKSKVLKLKENNIGC